jgi:hypothetical protein
VAQLHLLCQILLFDATAESGGYGIQDVEENGFGNSFAWQAMLIGTVNIDV